MRVPLVLLPGMMCDARLFEPQIEALSGVADVWVGDITRHSTMADLAHAVLAEAPFERFALAGLSMGGIVAMTLVAQAPERVTRLALLDTNHLAETPDRRALRQPQIERAKAGQLRAVLVDEMKPNYLGPAHRGDQVLLDRVLAMGMELGPAVFEHQSLALRDRPDSGHVLAGFDGPALVLCGEHDTLCPPERHEQMAALLSNSHLLIVPGAGHLTTLEEPAAVNEALRAWLLQEPHDPAPGAAARRGSPGQQGRQ